MIDGRIPVPVQQRLLAPLGLLSAEPVPPGLSGALIFRCRDRSGRTFALRRWPAATRTRRVNEIHRVVTFARTHGCTIVPRLYASRPSDFLSATTPGGDDCLAQHNGYLWDLCDWMPGTPLNLDASSDQIGQGVVAIAGFHSAVIRLGETKMCPPAVTARLARCRELNDQLPMLWQSAAHSFPHGTLPEGRPDLTRAVDDALQRLRLHWTEASTQISRSLARYEHIDLPAQYVLRDIHSEHLLFAFDQSSGGDEKAEPTGLIDFDAVRIDTPMTDIARWIGSFAAASDVRTWEVAMAGYWENSPSSLQGQAAMLTALVKDLAFATNWISLANWVVWVVAERQVFPMTAAQVATRIAKLLGFCRPEDLGGLR